MLLEGMEIVTWLHSFTMLVLAVRSQLHSPDVLHSEKESLLFTDYEDG
jgi:hypothetical protein